MKAFAAGVSPKRPASGDPKDPCSWPGSGGRHRHHHGNSPGPRPRHAGASVGRGATGPAALRQADMTITRLASAGARRTWLRPVSRCLLGTTAGPDNAPARQRCRSKHVTRIAAATVAVAALAGAGTAERAAVAASFAVLGHLHWLWIPAAVLLESASMAAFAIMLRRLLAAGGASVAVRPMLATAYAANAVSVSVPLAGPALATAFTFRRFTRQGADTPLASRWLLAGGVVSSAAAALVVVGGGLAAGNILVTAVAVPGGVLTVAVLAAAGAAAAARRARAASRMDAPAGIPAPGSACYRAAPDHPGA
jgi:hypothetical protein